MAADWTLSRFLIKMLSCFKRLMERAIAMDTASGSPSGIATMMRTTAMIPILRTASSDSFEKSALSVKMMTMSWKIK